MASSGANPSDVFDLRKIRRLVELMNEHELSEIDLRQAEHRIRLRKGHDPVVVGTPPVPAPAAIPAAPAPSGAAPADQSSEPAKDDATYVVSPMVGTFFKSPNPDAASFVQVGDRVGPETVVCIVEAMKVFNEIQAECAGTIAAALVENGEPVEYGQKLFKVVSEA